MPRMPQIEEQQLRVRKAVEGKQEARTKMDLIERTLEPLIQECDKHRLILSNMQQYPPDVD